MEPDRQVAAVAAICQKVNDVAAEGGASTVWLACGGQIREIEVATLEGDVVTFGYTIQTHSYKFRADHVVGMSYEELE